MKFARAFFGLGVALVLLVGAWASPQAQAQQVSISITPSLLELEAEPGSMGEQTITVANGGEEPLGAVVSPAEYPGADEDLSAKEWIEVEPARIDVAPGEEQEVTVKMHVPSDAQSGGRYAMVAFRTDPERAEGGSRAATSGQVGVPLLFTVKGADSINSEAEVTSVVPHLTEDGQIGFQVVLKNNGNVHFFPEGELEVSAGDGEKPTTLQVPQSTAILPGEERAIDALGSVPLESGEHTAEATIEYGGEEPATGELTFSPIVELEIEGLSVHERPDEGPELRLELANRGELALEPQVRLDVFNSGGLVGSAAPGGPVELGPGQEKEISAEYPGQLGPGKYSLQANVVYGDGRTLEEETTFTVKNEAPEAAQPGAPEPPAGVVGPNWLLIVGAPLGATLLLVAAIALLPPFKPVRTRIRRAWKAFSQSE